MQPGVSEGVGSRSGRRLKRVIVVADNSLIAEAVRSGLRNDGVFELLGYVDTRRWSVQAIVEAGPDVVLMDDMNSSDEAIELIRDLHVADPELAIMVLTVQMSSAWLDRAFGAGARGAISKSIHPVALATLVRETLAGNVVHAPKSMFSGIVPQPQLSGEHASLTERELEILRLVASGATNGEIARRLWVTEQTVKFHLSKIYRKLGVANRTGASHYAHTNGLLEYAAVGA